MRPLVLLTLLACHNDDVKGDPSDDTAPVVDDTGDTGAAPVDVCATLGLPVVDFVDTEDDDSLHAIAADLTVPVTTVDGLALDWSLRDQWTGCETYLFISTGSAQVASWSGIIDEGLFDRDIDTLLQRTPANTRLFLISGERDSEDRDVELDTALTEVLAALDGMDAEAAASWRDRIYFVQQRDSSIDGWLGDHFHRPAWGVGVDRFQRIRYIGSYADPDRYSSSAGWFEPNVSMAANEAIYYNFEASRQAALDAEGATVVTVFDDEVLSDPGWAGVKGSATVELPDDLSGFDSMELDLTLGCNGDGEYGTCPPWDYINYLYQPSVAPEDGSADSPCAPGDTEAVECLYPNDDVGQGSRTCDDEATWGEPSCPSRELGRWITTYHREGRWVHDASALLPLLGTGGAQTWTFYTQQEYVVDLSVRLFNAGKAARPTTTTWLFSGGAFNETYNDRDPVTVTVPASATKVELATIISGHGQVSPGTCAEFCETDHHFTINGTDNTITLSGAGSATGCMDKTDQGVIPNQYGTWWYGRSGWCPGWQVPVTVTDVTDQVTPGEDATITYAGFRNGDVYTSSGANIVMNAWLVVSE